MRAFYSKTITFLWERFHKLIILSNLCRPCTLLHLVSWMALAYSLCWSGSRWQVWCLCTSCACTLLHSTKGLVSWMALAYSLCWSGSRGHVWCLCTSCACTLLHSTKGLVNWMALAYSLCWSGSRWHAWCLCTSWSASSACTCSGTSQSADPHGQRCTAHHQLAVCGFNKDDG